MFPRLKFVRQTDDDVYFFQMKKYRRGTSFKWNFLSNLEAKCLKKRIKIVPSFENLKDWIKIFPDVRVWVQSSKDWLTILQRPKFEFTHIIYKSLALFNYKLKNSVVK